MTAVMDWRDIPKAERRALLRRAAERTVATALVLLAGYALLPLDRGLGASSLVLLGVGILALVAVLGRQVRKILHADYPMLQAIEALGVALPLLIVVFATTYFVMAYNSPASFSEPMTRSDSLYFTITTLGTVGYGDITPVTTYARMIASVQMLLDLVLIGALVRVLMGAAQHTVASRRADPPNDIAADHPDPTR